MSSAQPASPPAGVVDRPWLVLCYCRAIVIIMATSDHVQPVHSTQKSGKRDKVSNV
jgi:hypothetical protein